MTFAVHVMSKHDLKGYQRMNFLWLGYMRLTSLQIILRFAFYLAKLKMFTFLRSLSIFSFLVENQELIGLAIPDQDTMYLKTITKFQLMMSLDLCTIFVAFLVR